MLKYLAIFVLAVGMAGARAVADEGDGSLESALDQLRVGGNIIVMRHSTSPGNQAAPVGMTEGCKLAPGRGLSARGFSESRFAAEWLTANGVKIDKTYTSDLCRSYDTARLVAGAGSGPVIPRDEMKSDDPQVAAAFKAELEAELAGNPGANILLVSHSNITPLYWSAPLPGEEETPAGRIHIVKGGKTIRIDLNVAESAAPAIAE